MIFKIKKTKSKMTDLLAEEIMEQVNKKMDVFIKHVKILHGVDVELMWYNIIKTNPLLVKNKVKTIAKKTKTTKQSTLDTLIKKTKQHQETSVLKRIQQNIQTIHIRRNQYGNYVHEPTGLVFDRDEKIVYGRQEGSDVRDLTDEDIEQCKKYKFIWRIPENLDKYKENKIQTIDDYDIDEDEEDIVQSEEEESEEEEDETIYED
jgi:hypothetical protein